MIAALSEDTIIETFVSNIIFTTAGCEMMQNHSSIVYCVHSPIPAHFCLLLCTRDIVLLSCHIVSLHDKEDGHCTLCSSVSRAENISVFLIMMT